MKEKKRKIIRAQVINLHPAMCAFTDSLLVSNQGQNYTFSELHHCITYSVKKKKHTFRYGKNDFHSLKNIFWYRGATT